MIDRLAAMALGACCVSRLRIVAYRQFAAAGRPGLAADALGDLAVQQAPLEYPPGTRPTR